MVDFLEDSNNVYCTAKYIVAQKISIVVSDEDEHFTTTIDTFYKRTEARNKQYALAFIEESKVTGGRISCDVTKRHYVD